MTLYTASVHSPIGELKLISDDTSIQYLFTETQVCPHFQKLLPGDHITHLQNAQKWLDEYFKGYCPDPCTLSLSPHGTPFQMQVWQRLLRIPYGETVTYGQLAVEFSDFAIGKRMSAQAIGQAVGANPLPVLIPCHRVVGSNGKLGGYSGGIEKKVWLLSHETSKIGNV